VEIIDLMYIERGKNKKYNNRVVRRIIEGKKRRDIRERKKNK